MSLPGITGIAGFALSSVAAAVINLANVDRIGVGSFTTSSASYVDLLDNAAGATYSVSFTKASAGTDVYVYGAASFVSNSGNCVAIIGVNDGTTDYDLGRSAATTGHYTNAGGMITISGLAAGAYTFKLRVKLTANTINFNGTSCAAALTVEEAGTGYRNVKASSLAHVGGTNFNTASTSYVDLQHHNGGNNIEVTITKAAGTDLVIRGKTVCQAGASPDTCILGYNDGTNDHDLGMNRALATPWTPVSGEAVLSGLAAGTYTIKLRVKTTGGNSLIWPNSQVSSSISVKEVAAGSVQNINVTPFGSSYTLNSTSYTNLLQASGGSAVSVTITKAAAGTRLVISSGVSYALPTGTNNTVTAGYREGSTDHDLAAARVLNNNGYSVAEGEQALAGLAAGSQTITSRVKNSAASNVTYNTVNSAWLSVEEVPA